MNSLDYTMKEKTISSIELKGDMLVLHLFNEAGSRFRAMIMGLLPEESRAVTFEEYPDEEGELRGWKAYLKTFMDENPSMNFYVGNVSFGDQSILISGIVHCAEFDKEGFLELRYKGNFEFFKETK